MAVPTKHIVHQGPVLRALGGTALAALKQQLNPPADMSPPATPTPEVTATLPPRDPNLVKDYVRHVGGDPSAYKKVLPPHMFPQWTFGVAFQTLKGINYPLFKVLNGGCRVEVNSPLPAGEPLRVTATLHDVDDNGRRAVLHQRIVTETASAPQALVSHLYAIVPLPKKKGTSKDGSGAKKKAKEVERVPLGAQELQRWKLKADAGLHFALLTGDFNPVHWVSPYAKAFGFKNTILHGFGTMARAWEGLQRTRMAGAAGRIRTFDVKFTKPLVLPAKTSLFAQDEQLWVANAPGGPAYLAGSFTTTD